jgi:hypothetical protein
MKILKTVLAILFLLSSAVFAKFCPDCGCESKDDANFCVKCGHAFGGASKDKWKGVIDLTGDSDSSSPPPTKQVGQDVPSVEEDTVVVANNDIINSVVIVHTLHPNNAPGQATAFLADFSGETYLVTNQHVLFGAIDMKLTTLSGDTLKPLSYEFVLTQDLVRMKVDCGDFKYTPIPVSYSQPQIGDAITAYGNSEGQSTISPLQGEVMGVGNKALEISATIVYGNSGGPIVNDRGEVVCVSTRGYKSQPDWTNEDTRFARTRRFGERLLEDAEWKELPLKDFCEQSYFLHDMLLLFKDVELIAIGHSTSINIFETDLVKTRYYNKTWHKLLNDIVTKYLKPDRYGKIHEIIVSNTDMYDDLQALVSARGEFMSQAKWHTKFLHEEAIRLYGFQQFLYSKLEAVKGEVISDLRAGANERLYNLERKINTYKQKMSSIEDQIAVTKADMDQVRAEWHKARSLDPLEPQLEPYREILKRLYGKMREIKIDAAPVVKEYKATKKMLTQ